MRVHLTEALLDRARVRGDVAQGRLWDTEVAGFGCVVGRHSMAFVVKRSSGERQWFTIGRRGDTQPDGSALDVARAREIARDILAKTTELRRAEIEMMRALRRYFEIKARATTRDP